MPGTVVGRKEVRKKGGEERRKRDREYECMNFTIAPPPEVFVGVTGAEQTKSDIKFLFMTVRNWIKIFKLKCQNKPVL